MSRRYRVGPLAVLATGSLLFGCGGSTSPTAVTATPTTPTASSPPPPAPAPPVTNGTVWDDDIWFAGSLDREQFVEGELRRLLGRPARTSGEPSALTFVEPGRYVYTSPVGDDVPVLALAPGGSPAVGDPATWDVARGLVVALHQTNIEGPTEPCGPDPGASLASGAAFASRGYAVVCPNLAFTGERQPENQWDTAALYAEHPGWSAMGKDVAEVSWLLDSIGSAGLSAERVVVAGHSQGAVYSIYAGALDDRVDVVVANAGFVDTPTDPHPERWSRPTWYRGFREMPVGLDMLEVVAAIAPRCALLTSYTADEILEATLPEPGRLSDFEDRYPSIEWRVVEGPHDWTAADVASSAMWLDGAWSRCPT